MSMINAIAELQIKRDIYRNNADVIGREAQEQIKESQRLRSIAAELDDAIMILEDRES